MPPAKKKPRLSQVSFIDLLERERKTFGEVNRPLLAYQQNRLDLCLQLFDDDAVSSNLSSAQRFGKSRARTILIDILNRQREWAFLLCAVAASVSMIQKISDDVILGVHQWFENAECPRGLTAKAEEVCAGNSRLKHLQGSFPFLFKK